MSLSLLGRWPPTLYFTDSLLSSRSRKWWNTTSFSFTVRKVRDYFLGHLTPRPKPSSGLKQMQNKKKNTWKSSSSLSCALWIKSALLSETAIIGYGPSLNLNKFCLPKMWKKLPHSLHLVSISAILLSRLPHLQFKMQLQECLPVPKNRSISSQSKPLSIRRSFTIEFNLWPG